PEVARGHELRLAHRSGPRSFQARRLDVAAVQNLERVEQLGAGKSRSSRVPRQRGERANGRTDATEDAEVGLDAPDARDDARRHAVLRGDTVEHRPVAAKSVATSLNE